MKPREILLAWFTCVIALFCVTAFLCKPWFDSWRELRDRKDKAQRQIRRENDIRLEKEKTARRQQELQKKVSPLPAGWIPVTDLPRLINDLAGQCGVPIKSTSADKESALGNLKILPIRYDWGECTTQAIRDLLVAFHENNIIFDVVELEISSSGQDRLNGKLAVNCVFTGNDGKRK